MVKMRSDMSVELIDFMGSDARVVQAARVSTLGAESKDEGERAGLINFLAREKHNSVFEHQVFTFLVQAPIFVINQMVRHTSISYNIESGRYRELENVFYAPDADRPLVQVGKTGNYDFEAGEKHLKVEVSDAIHDASVVAWDEYTYLLKQGVAKEVARMVLPLNIYSSVYATMNTRSLMSFLNQRLAKEAQYEIREVATKMCAHFEDKMPLTYDAWWASA